MVIYSVGQLNDYMSRIIDNDYFLKKVSVKGEITNYKKNSSSVTFLSLKDETGILPCIMYESDRKKLDFEIDNGQAVECVGSVTVYKKDGKYQYVIRAMTKAGEGKQALEFEKLKQKLYDEGLFDFEIKKPIPKHPKTVGIVSSDMAAGLQDFVTLAKQRDPYVQLILCVARVQGKNSVATVVQGIKRLDAMNLDAIIVCRGGGSMEELWNFNDEKIVRAIYEAKTPIVTGIGHDKDVFLADYAADLRTITPSAACVAVIPNVGEVIRNLRYKEQQVRRAMLMKYQTKMALLERYKVSLEGKNPVARLKLKKEQLKELSNRVHFAMDRRYNRYASRLSVVTAKIHGLSPTAKLVGGFGYIETNNGPVTSVFEVDTGDNLNIIISDGSIKAKVTEVMEKN